MDFKQLTIELLSGKLDAGTKEKVTLDKPVCEELFSLMMLLSRLWGASMTPKKLEEIFKDKRN